MAGTSLVTDLDDVLFFISILGNKRGQAQIEKEAAFRSGADFSLDPVESPDFAMKARSTPPAQQPGPAGGELRPGARVRQSPRTSTTRCSGLWSCPPGAHPGSGWLKAKAGLEDYFTNQEQLGRGTNLLLYEHPKELWFEVRIRGGRAP